MSNFTPLFWVIIYLGGFSALGFVYFLIRRILREDQGNERMIELSTAIRVGAKAFLRHEYRYLSVFTIVVAVILGIFIEPRGLVGLSFIFGALVSSSVGYIGMMIATAANARTAEAARDKWSRALVIAFSSGGVMGFSSVGFGILGLATLVLLFPGEANYHVWIGFAFGSSAVALFMRVGGGIFTKCADVGADLVGKVEQNIPEDDDRNAAVIADNVGDNVGDVAGMGSDLYESYVSIIAAAMVLAMVAFHNVGSGVFLPLVLGATGIFSSIIGALFVRPTKEAENFEKQVSYAHEAMNRGVMISNAIAIVLSFLVIWLFFSDNIIMTLKLFGAVIVGLIAGTIVSFSAEYYTSAHYSPTKRLAKRAESGAAIVIVEGISLGMISTVIPVITVVTATVIAYMLIGVTGVAIGALGMMLNLGILLSMDCYGPIADNAAGIAEMANMGQEVRERCEALDAVGNTTAALGKGFAIASAALSALAWLVTYFEVVDVTVDQLSIERVDVIIGFFIGGMMTFVLSALVMKGVSKGADEIVKEVRRQFREIPGIMERENKPDYVSTVNIATKQAILSMIAPGLLTISVPILLGLTLGPSAVGGLLLGALGTGFLLALMMANSGGAWDNAKKYIEAGHFGGKGTEVHKTAIVGDTVGDPFKDTAGPALDILIKLVGVVAVMFGPLFGAALFFGFF